MKLLLLTLVILYSYDAHGRTGVMYESGNEYTAIRVYRTLKHLKFSESLFNLHQGKSSMYGIDMDVGYRLIDTRYVDMYPTAGIGGGLTLSDPVQKPECVKEALSLTETDKEKVDEVKKKIQDIKESGKKANRAFEESLLEADYQACLASKRTSESTSRYGGVAYYKAGVSISIKPLPFLNIEGFAGKSVEHRSSYGNTGDIDVSRPVVKFGIGVEW